MDTDELEALIEDAIEDADATVTNPRMDGEHFEATVVAPAFADLPLVKQHQRVYDALEGVMTTEVHALELETRAPGEN